MWYSLCIARKFINFSYKNNTFFVEISNAATVIAVDMRMICKFIFQRGKFEVIDVERREFSAFDGTLKEKSSRTQDTR
jgi:hypothetical protein